MKYISIGEWNNYYYYILFSALFISFNSSLYTINHNNSFIDFRFPPFDINKKYFSNHIFIHQTFNYFGTFILGIIFFQIEAYKSQRENTELINKQINNEDQENKSNSKIRLIYKKFEQIYYKKNSFLFLLLIITLWVFYEQFIQIYNKLLKDLDFWMIELLILSYINDKLLGLKLYEHQKFAIKLNLIICLFKIIVIILSFVENEITNDIFYATYWFLVPIGIIIYLIAITIRSYVNVKIKWFMDEKYISPNKLLIIYGFMGIIFSFIICIISTFSKCDKNIEKIEQLCKIPNKNNTDYIYDSNDIYFESFDIYFKTFKRKIYEDINGLEIFYEIIIIFLGFISFFFYKYYSILIIKYLSPVHFIFSNPIFFLIKKIIYPINTLILVHSFFFFIKKDGKDLDSNAKSIKITKYFLDLLSDIISSFGFLIYLEIFELNFCNLNYDIRRNIINRGIIESHEIPNINIIEELNDEDNDYENEDK